MRFRTQPFWLITPALAFLPLITAQRASAQSIVYDNTTTGTGGVVFRGSTNHSGNTLTDMNADDLTLAPGSGGQNLTHFLFESFNFATSAITARPSIFFWAADGNSGNPGNYLAGITLPDTTFAARQVTPLSSNIAFTIPANGKIWAGIVFDDDFGTTGATPAQLDSLGGVTYDPPAIGSSGFGAAFGTLSSYAGVNNPSVTDYDFGGSTPINFGWQLQAATTPEPGSLVFFTVGALGVGLFSRHRIAKAPKKR